SSCVPCLFILRARRPPGPTLFPYTTLFRSISDGTIDIPRERKLELIADLTEHGEVAREEFVGGVHRRGVDTLAARGARGRCVEGDRKSTRLNSSHVSISYAVFCSKQIKPPR